MADKPKTILIVEDNELSRKLLAAVLELGQYRILSAPDAETGILLVREHHPDLIIMDIQLPGLDGICATALLKEDIHLKQIPVIALSGYGSDFEPYPDHSSFSGFITNPFNVLSLLRLFMAMEELIRRADQALYQSKQEGKNRFTFYGER